MAAARSGARLPILRCWAWLKLATRVAGGAGIWASSWHCRQTVFAGSRLSDALLLPAAAVWHVVHGSWRPRWSLCEKGAAWGMSYAAPFSHKLHLGLQLPCTTCHTAAAGSSKASDNLLPAKTVCLQCHEDAQSPAPPASHVASFSHAHDLKIGNLASLLAAAID